MDHFVAKPVRQAVTLGPARSTKLHLLAGAKAAVAGGPAATPTDSPKAPSTPATPSTPPTPANPSPFTPSVPAGPSPSESGSKTIPSTAGASSDGTSNQSSRHTMISILVLAACVPLTSF